MAGTEKAAKAVRLRKRRSGMADLEKVIKGLAQCLKGTGCSSCENCPYNSVGVDFRCRVDLRDDALALLKAQEPLRA